MSKIQRSRKGKVKWNSILAKIPYWFVVKELVGREIKRKYARSYLGVVWSVLNPLLLMIVMTLVFSTMFRRNIENFPLYYLTGSIFWNLFSTGTDHAMSAIVDNKGLILKSKNPKIIFVISRMGTALVNFGFSLIPYVAILLFFRIRPTWRIILLIPDLLIFLVFCMGLSFFLSVVYVFFADIKYLYSVILRILLYLSAIFYPVDRLPDFMKVIIAYNPVFLAIDIARYSVVYGITPYYTEWIKLIIWAVVTFIVGYISFKKNENKVMQVI